MDEEKKASELPLLDKPRIRWNEPGFISQLLFYLPVLLLGAAGAIGSFCSAFRIPLNYGPLFFIGFISCLFSLVISLSRRSLLIAALAGVSFWALEVYLQFDKLKNGILLMANHILNAYGEKLNMDLGGFTLQYMSPATQAEVCTAVISILFLPFFWFLTWLLVSRKSCLAAFCLTGLFLLSHLVLSIMPSFSILVLLLMFWAVLLFISPALGQRHRLLEDKGRFLASGPSAARPSTLLLLPAIGLCMALIYAICPPEDYKRLELADQLLTGITEGFDFGSPIQGGLGNGNSRVSLDSLGDRSYTGETVLRVKYEWQDKNDPFSNVSVDSNTQKDFLKSFVGSVYTGNSWERLPSDIMREEQELLGDYASMSLPAQFDELLEPSLFSSRSRYSLTVENISANPRCVFMPYGVSDTAQSLKGQSIEKQGDGFYSASGFFTRVKDYHVNAVGLPFPTLITDRLKDLWLQQIYTSSAYMDFDSFTTVEDLEDYMHKLNGELDRLDSQFNDDLSSQIPLLPEEHQDFPFYYLKTPQYALETLKDEQLQFVTAMEDYSQFAAEHYTQLPRDLKAFLTDYIEERHLFSYDIFYISQIASELTDLFYQDFEYSLSPPTLPQGEDFVEYFLGTSRVGYCVHFATAAVALLRAAGIPARYAEGYAVPSGSNGSWQDIKDSSAHAWAEVYVSGTGWIPIEVTPSSPDSPATYDTATAPEATPQPTQAPEESQPSQTESEISQAPSSEQSSPSSTPRPEEQANAPAKPIWPGLLGALAAFLLLLLLLWCNRRIHIYMRRRAFTQRDRSKAALSVYAHLLKLNRYASPGSEPPGKWEDLALKARFGRDMLSEEELHSLISAKDALEHKLKGTMLSIDLLRLKYLLGLL